MSASVYEPQNLEQEAVKNMALMDSIIEIKSLTKLLVEKGIVSNVEMDYMRRELKNSPEYKVGYETAKKALELASLYKNDPQTYLRELLNAKLNGSVR